MPTVYIRTNQYPHSIGTTRSITVTTATAQQIVSLSGYMGWLLTNLGPSTIAYGDSNIAISSAGLLFYSMAKEYYPIADTMSMYVRADSVAAILGIDEYL